jgi:hypothetical protein
MRPSAPACAAWLFLAGCTCGQPDAEGSTPSEPARTTEAPSPPSVSTADLPPLPRARHEVEALWVVDLSRPGDGAEDGDFVHVATVAVAGRGTVRGAPPADAAVLGATSVHEGTYTFHQLGEVRSPYSTVTLVGTEGTCEVGVQRAIDAWETLRDDFADAGEEPEAIGEDEPDPELVEPEAGEELDRRVLALVLDRSPESCGIGIVQQAIAGAPVTRRALEPSMLGPASAALTAVVHRHEREIGVEPSSRLRAIALGEEDAFVVAIPEMAYVVRGQVVSPLDALPYAELRAGSRTFLHCSSPHDDFLAALDELRRPSPPAR